MIIQRVIFVNVKITKILQRVITCVIFLCKGGKKVNRRIKELRKSLNMNQTDFGTKIGVKQTTIAGYESGIRTPTDAVILSICREFNINETWLRTGKGERNLSLSEDDEIMKYVGLFLKDKEDFVAQKIKRFIVGYEKLDAEDKKIIENLMHQIFEDEKKEPE